MSTYTAEVDDYDCNTIREDIVADVRKHISLHHPFVAARFLKRLLAPYHR